MSHEHASEKFFARHRKLKRVLILSAMVSLMLALTIYFQPRVALRWVARRSPKVLYFVETKAPVVALTIDDGPHPVATPQILDVLKAHAARATFFLIGNHIKGNEHLLERMRAEGHELGNHLGRDYPSILLPRDRFEREMLEVDRLIYPVGPIKWLRPGSGWYTRSMLKLIQKHGYRCALGSIYPHDPMVPSVWINSHYIIQQVFPGGIIIIHDGPQIGLRSAQVLRRVLPALQSKGYQIVTLSELVRRPETGG